MQEHEIARLGIDDWKELRRLRLDALHHAPGSFGQTLEDVETLGDDHWRNLLASPYHEFYAVRVAGGPAGMGAIKTESSPHARHVGTVFWIHIDPALRRRGLARLLMRHLVDRLRAMPGIAKAQLGVHATEAGAVALYEQLGFERSGLARKALRIDGAYVDLVSMETLFEEKL